MTKTCFNKTTGTFEIAWPERVARHDIVYEAPPSDPMQYGMPLGNGDIGALVWCDDRKIFIAFNKCDLWDDAAFGPFRNWKPEQEECSSTLRHGCRIIIDFGMPIFDAFYLKDFQGRLRLQDGCAVMHLEGPFGKLDASFFVTYDGSVLCANIKTDFAEDDGIEITMERYGCRSYAHWYRFHERNPELGLPGTDAYVKENCLLISHSLTTGSFLCALRPEAEGLRQVRRTSHMVSSRADRCPKELTFYALITSPLEQRENEAYALETLKHASMRGFDTMLAENERCWKAFWEKSFVETDDDYLDNLWHLTMYYSCAGQRGRYPGRFINSLWNWNRDVQPWNFYFHWNQQEVYWGLNAAGHHELCESYLNYRFDGMEHSRESAEQLFGLKDGLFVSDVCERRGYNSASEAHNHTPVGEIAMDFWRQYCYTGDENFLREKALPYMLGAARFFVSLFVLEPDGNYHAKSGTCYEGSDLFYDAITELAMGKVLFDAVLQALQITGIADPDAEKFREIRDHLAVPQILEDNPRMIQPIPDGTGTLLRGIFKGKNISGNKVLAVGSLINENSPLHGQYVPQYEPQDVLETAPVNVVDAVRDMLYLHYIPNALTEDVKQTVVAHPQSNVAPVFPMNMIGLKDKGSELFDAAVATALISRDQQIMGWDPMPIVLARLGLSDELDVYLKDYPSVWQYYNNGFGHYGGNEEFVSDMVTPFRRYLVTSTQSDDEIFWAESFPFRHMGLEPLGVFSAAMNERLLQSFDGVIRIAPAYGKHNGRFQLHAVGGFVVMCEIKDGVPAFVAIRSLRGERLVLENPWSCAWYDGVSYTDKTLELDTEAEKTYLFTPDGKEDFDYEAEVPTANKTYKVRPDRRAMLGLPRSF